MVLELFCERMTPVPGCFVNSTLIHDFVVVLIL